MTTLDHGTHETLRFPERAAIATRIVAAVADGWRAWKNRRAFHRLGELSDAELLDIGLTRADLSVAGSVAFGDDPTAHLSGLAEARALSTEHAARMVG